jgi:hypothetical protein
MKGVEQSPTGGLRERDREMSKRERGSISFLLVAFC